jgi:hypothetical protein
MTRQAKPPLRTIANPSLQHNHDHHQQMIGDDRAIRTPTQPNRHTPAGDNDNVRER